MRGSSLCEGLGAARPGSCTCSPPTPLPVPGKVLMQNKCIYHFQPLGSQGRASCLGVECQLAVGTVAGGQRKFHSSPRFLPLRRVLRAQQQAVQRPASTPALETRLRAPAGPFGRRPANPATVGRTLRPSDRPHLAIESLSNQECGPRGKSMVSRQVVSCLHPMMHAPGPPLEGARPPSAQRQSLLCLVVRGAGWAFPREKRRNHRRL